MPSEPIIKFLVERVGQKLQGWQHKSISRGGKLVLLKTAAQTVPNFWMSLLLVPAEICNSIQRQMNAFWWGGGGSGRGIKWLAWDRLCNAKEDGGLGFKNLKLFNIVMLAKQGWRLLNNANPLVTSLMKARYFPHTDFLNAKLGANPSYTWRSILEAQDVIKQGCRKRIGDGQSTNIWEVPWLPCRANGYLTSTAYPELKEALVENLMEVGKSKWDKAVLLDILNDRDM
ncbi:putative mitochondrial protein AtMg00310 [Apium graveolens]|uniref:putative mitochondrial protein AtMg00310 n=1 Tax=Apium graveolens TaxID=4045 RepID=UPI003D7B8DF8